MTDINPDGALPPAQRALHEIAQGSENVIALSTLAVSEVLLPVPALDDFPEDPSGPGDADAAAGAAAPEAGGMDSVDGSAGTPEPPREIQLPVYEQDDGRQLVPVFTSETRMAEALPATRRYRLVQLAALSGAWPSDELILSIDTGSPDALSISGEGVRALAGLVGGT
ncbi:SseB protein N-terminal domain-containing protein [Streptomyces sp. DvalAA-14]|uniref:SseB family protein n=1 Tax=unclassified Streptomyces TaxID=2593676 RepID=UPI00081B6600|nr:MULTISPECIES: SseB family protein [unclassified Streptomyces]MYS20132.1 SseB family protein [Streptomyces sp. SID4948]SCD61529.1 SseB protein N-terminal domain-containing protein [Streptomyces sp. DvalAA-14]